MSGYPISPRLQKGALVGLDPFNPLASVIVFQYNPETLTRTLTANTKADPRKTEQQAEVLRLVGPPTEEIKLDIELDATDQMEKGDPIALDAGIHPTLASLEMLLYPKSITVILKEVLVRAGLLEVTGLPQQPLTLFVWGQRRVLPVRLSSMSITEDFFDPALNPIRAHVNLGLRVLNYRDLGLGSVGGAIFLAHQIAKETMATLAGLGTVASGSVSFALPGGLLP
jgi:hypothetical protein